MMCAHLEEFQYKDKDAFSKFVDEKKTKYKHSSKKAIKVGKLRTQHKHVLPP